MRNPIKDMMETNRHSVKLWWAGTLLNFIRIKGTEEYKRNMGSYHVHSSYFTKKEIKGIREYIKKNQKEFPHISFLKEIKIDDEVIYTNNEFFK